MDNYIIAFDIAGIDDDYQERYRDISSKLDAFHPERINQSVLLFSESSSVDSLLTRYENIFFPQDLVHLITPCVLKREKGAFLEINKLDGQNEESETLYSKFVVVYDISNSKERDTVLEILNEDLGAETLSDSVYKIGEMFSYNEIFKKLKGKFKHSEAEIYIIYAEKDEMNLKISKSRIPGIK